MKMNKYKEWLIILVGTGILIVLVLILVDSKKDQSGSPSTSNLTSNQTEGTVAGAQTDNSMDDHHKPQASDSQVFDSLVGKKAPDFTLKDYEGKEISLSSLKDKKVVLFFNEGLMCYPACWNQIAAFGKKTELGEETTVLNIVLDSQSDWKDAIQKMPELGAATVLFDTNKTVSNLYGVLSLSSSMHKGQFPGHSYVIVDKEGVVRFARDDEQMAVRNKEISAEIAKI